MDSIREIFIDSMVEEQEFVEVTTIYNEITGYDEVVSHPFRHYEIVRLHELFEVFGNRGIDVTEEIIVNCLTKYTSLSVKRIERMLLDD